MTYVFSDLIYLYANELITEDNTYIKSRIYNVYYI